MERFGKLLMVVALLELLLVLFGFHAFGCDKDELDALLELKAAINYPNGTALPQWTELDQAGKPTDCCLWDGVVCGERGRVEELYLEGVRKPEVEGDWYVNASLFLPFPHLLFLDLYNNSITGWTHHLRQLSSLEELYLGWNKLEGMIDVYDIEGLENLQLLELNGNSIDGFKKSHGKLSDPSKLEMLFLEEIKFSDANTFMDSLSFFPFLQSLYLGRNNFTGLNQTSGWLGQLKNIQVIDIANTHLEGQFPLWLRNLTSLQSIDLGQNNLYGKLPSFLGNLSALQILELPSNQFVGNVANSPLTKLTSLSVLSLSSNNFQIPQTFRSFANHSSLKLLWLDDNNLISDNATHHPFVPDFQLSFLSLSNCKIVANLPHFLLSQHNLRYLDLSHNYIKGNFPSWIVKNNTFLELLTLHNNSLGSLYLSSHFHHHIKELDVSYNKINYLPTSLLHLTALRILHLNNNNLSGLIPSSLIPSSLIAIDLSNNHLGGQIPTNICNLNFLNLSNNSIFGFLPPCFSESDLTYVFLNKNKLNGSLSPIFKKDNSLVILDLGSNQLSGMIPDWIGELGNLSSLILSNNHFESHIPTQVCSLKQLTILDLSNNNLYGKIPNCLSQITFQTIGKKSIYVESGTTLLLPTPQKDLLSNDYYYYSQQIYSSLSVKNKLDITTKSHTYTYSGEDLDAMCTIDLSCNNLSGHIPLEIGRMTGVRGLNLSHNNFIGSIPSTLSKLSYIESLDLSYNDLNGSIPPELTQLYTLEVFSMAYNNLSGRIPDEKAQFGTFDESSYQGNPYLCGPPLLNECSTTTPKDRVVEDVDVSMDMYVFYICFTVSSVIMFVGTLIVLYVNPHWRRMWFYYGEMWITCVYYFIVDNMGKALKASIGVISRLIYCY